MIMYRHAPLRVACAGCGAPLLASLADYDVFGGYVCWHCLVAGQIRAHRGDPPIALQAWTFLSVSGGLVLMLWLLALVHAFFGLESPSPIAR
jgi:hypothetical protein